MLLQEINILVVEDVEGMRNQIKMLLRGFGFRRITLCGDMPTATTLLEQEQYQLILCDWHMGMISGLDFLRYVRGNGNLKSIGFIMVTAESTKEHVIEAIRTGVDDYLVKPLTIGQIQDKVYGVLLKKQVL